MQDSWTDLYIMYAIVDCNDFPFIHNINQYMATCIVYMMCAKMAEEMFHIIIA